jgi:outer membrane protein
MEKKFKLFIIGAVSLIVLQGAFTITWMTSGSKTAYINTETVYNNFELKKKLEADLKSTQSARQYLLDSLRFQLEILSVEVQKPEKKGDSILVRNFNGMREYYFQQQQQFQEDNDALAEKYTGQVWAQLNQYIKEYGTEQNYEYIFGASGDGALMYANDAVNITDEVNGYVNERFQGKP